MKAFTADLTIATYSHPTLDAVDLILRASGAAGSLTLTFNPAQIEQLRDALAEIPVARQTEVHQPRERAVPCQGCGRDTFEYHARCAACGGAVCNRCDPAVDNPTARGIGVLAAPDVPVPA